MAKSFTVDQESWCRLIFKPLSLTAQREHCLEAGNRADGVNFVYVTVFTSLFNGRVHYILTLVYKCVNGWPRNILLICLVIKSTALIYVLVVHILLLSLVLIPLDMACTLSYYGSKLWNFLPNTTRSLPTVAAFKSTIRNLEFDTDCCPFCR